MYRSKRIYLNLKKSNWCIVKLFSEKKEMRDYYFHHCQKRGLTDKGIYETEGVSLQFEIHKEGKLSPQTGIVLLCMQQCGAGIVSHELLHAVLWAYKFKKNKKQYPIVIKDMKEEEIILHNLTGAVVQFYKWYWKVVA